MERSMDGVLRQPIVHSSGGRGVALVARRVFTDPFDSGEDQPWS